VLVRDSERDDREAAAFGGSRLDSHVCLSHAWQGYHRRDGDADAKPNTGKDVTLPSAVFQHDGVSILNE
jgi:hypothetical protein